MTHTSDEIRKFIDDDLDWMFNVGVIKKIDYEKGISKEWDYVLKIKFEPPTPMDLERIRRESEQIRINLKEWGLLDEKDN